MSASRKWLINKLQKKKSSKEKHFSCSNCHNWKLGTFNAWLSDKAGTKLMVNAKYKLEQNKKRACGNRIIRIRLRSLIEEISSVHVGRWFSAIDNAGMGLYVYTHSRWNEPSWLFDCCVSQHTNHWRVVAAARCRQSNLIPTSVAIAIS